MPKFQIIGGPDRLAFTNSLFAGIDSDPVLGYLPPPSCRGGIKPPSYRGEAFLTRNEESQERELVLIITSTKRNGRHGMVQEFSAILWAACDEFRDLIAGDPMTCWIEFKGELDFRTQQGWLARVESPAA